MDSKSQQAMGEQPRPPYIDGRGKLAAFFLDVVRVILRYCPTAIFIQRTNVDISAL